MAHIEIRGPKMRERKPDEVLAFIKKRAFKDDQALRAPAGTRPLSRSNDGIKITAEDLVRVSRAVEAIPDAGDRKRVLAHFSTFTKYQALSIITDPSSVFRQKYPDAINAIADAATKLDHHTEETPLA